MLARELDLRHSVSDFVLEPSLSLSFQDERLDPPHLPQSCPLVRSCSASVDPFVLQPFHIRIVHYSQDIVYMVRSDLLDPLHNGFCLSDLTQMFSLILRVGSGTLVAV